MKQFGSVAAVLIVLGGAGCATSGSTSAPRAGASPAVPPGAIHWVRASAEYRAATVQAYRMATRRVDVVGASMPPGSWAVSLDADETVLAAYQRMKLYDVSQLPVLENGKVVGIVDEQDILMEVIDNPAHFREPVTEAMESHIVTVAPDASVAQLMDIFRRGMVAIVIDGDEFLGLITRIDVLNWLRRRTQP